MLRVAALEDWDGMFCGWVGFYVDDGDGGVVVGSSTYRWGRGEGWRDLCLSL